MTERRNSRKLRRHSERDKGGKKDMNPDRKQDRDAKRKGNGQRRKGKGAERKMHRDGKEKEVKWKETEGETEGEEEKQRETKEAGKRKSKGTGTRAGTGKEKGKRKGMRKIHRESERERETLREREIGRGRVWSLAPECSDRLRSNRQIPARFCFFDFLDFVVVVVF